MDYTTFEDTAHLVYAYSSLYVAWNSMIFLTGLTNIVAIKCMFEIDDVEGSCVPHRCSKVCQLNH
jgi:hypothetical protein